MANREEPVQYVEIDFDQCTLAWGTGACTAALSVNTPNKCRNTWNTCKDKTNYDKGTLTLRFIKPRPKMPVDGRVFFPTLKSVSAFSSTVNIVGFKQDLGSLGRRGTVSVVLGDHAYGDKETDPYASERKSGAAQFSGTPIDPFQHSTFWTKLRSWSPNYAERAIRVVNTHIYLLSDGTPVWSEHKETRHFIISDMSYDYSSKSVTISGKDVLTLAEKKSAVAPAASNGVLLEDIEDTDTELTLSPEGIGDLEYPATGWAVIGSEIVVYSRSGDTITLTGRGLLGTEASSHSEEDSFQQALRFNKVYLNEVIETLLGETDIPDSFYDVTEYQDEVVRWASTLKVDTIITEPTAVITLLGELVTLGVSLWWDDVDQKIKMKMNHPLDFSETVHEISDDGNIKEMSVIDKDEERITQVHFYSVQSDPTQSVDEKDNYDRISVTFDDDSQNENNNGSVRIKEVFCRWLNSGNTAAIRILSKRYLQRFKIAPKYHTITLDNKDGEVHLADVLGVTSAGIVGEDLLPKRTLLQVIGKTEEINGHEVKYTAQSYEFDQFYSFVMENDANDHSSATDRELEQGCYIVDGSTLLFTDNSPPYRIM